MLHLILVLRLQGRLAILSLLFYVVPVFGLLDVFLGSQAATIVRAEIVAHVLGYIVVVLLTQILV